MKTLVKLILTLLVISTFIFTQEKSIEQIMEEEKAALKALENETTDYYAQIEKEFRFYEEKISREYDLYEKQVDEEMKALEEEIMKKWGDKKIDTKEEYVNYDKDLNARGSVNFKNGIIDVEVIVEKPKIDSKPKKAEKQRELLAKKRLQKKLKELLTQKGNDQKPLLQKQIKTTRGKTVTKKNADKYTKNTINKSNIRKKEYKAKDGKTRIKYKVRINMVPNHIEQRAERFKTEVIKQSKRFKIKPSVAFAVMHTESYYNPKARSHVPAYGLMQLVPRSGGRDAYNYIYKKDKLLKSRYLYNAKNNIELGCAYLSKIRYVYFKKIKNDQAAYYCTVCAYNTGAGNVARAITGTKKLGTTAKTVNAHNSKWVYKKLIKNLPYKETKDYLERVNKREQMYVSWN